MYEIKECPFCGGKAELKSDSIGYGQWIECAECGCRTKEHNLYYALRDRAIESARDLYECFHEYIVEETKKTAVESWNGRKGNNKMYFHDLERRIKEDGGLTKETAYDGLEQLIESVGSCVFEYMTDADKELMRQCLDEMDKNNY